MAAATGSSTRRTSPSPARAAAASNTRWRGLPHAAGQVSVTTSGGYAGDAPGLVGDEPQDRSDQVLDPQFDVAEEDHALVDAPFRVGLQPAGVQPGTVQGVATDHEPTGVVQVHGGGQQRGTVEQQRLGPPVGPAEHGHRVRRPEVDTEPESWGLHTGTLGM